MKDGKVIKKQTTWKYKDKVECSYYDSFENKVKTEKIKLENKYWSGRRRGYLYGALRYDLNDIDSDTDDEIDTDKEIPPEKKQKSYGPIQVDKKWKNSLKAIEFIYETDNKRFVDKFGDITFTKYIQIRSSCKCDKWCNCFQ